MSDNIYSFILLTVLSLHVLYGLIVECERFLSIYYLPLVSFINV